MASASTSLKQSSTVAIPSQTVNAIFEELRLLRHEISLLLPSEDLEEYAHPDRIRRSYQNARRNYPPISV